MTIVDVFKLLSDTSRLRILYLLNHNEDICVCEFEYILGLSQPNISKHLNNMKKMGVVEDEKKDKFVFYRLSEEFLSQFLFVSESLKETGKFEVCKKDYEKLQEYKKSDLCCTTLSRINMSK
ncbi:MAG: ArsR/SmtB family transcription factor [Coprobacillaceae bacterium]